jgi:hypothetical protein
MRFELRHMVLAATVASWVVAAPAWADLDRHAREHSIASSPAADEKGDYGHAIDIARPELHTSVGAHGDFGTGVRLDLPIVPWGILRHGHDEFALSPGIDFQFLDFGKDHNLLLMPQLATQWNFYFRRGWSIFPELGVCVVIGDVGHDYQPLHHHGSIGTSATAIDGVLAFGARRHFTSRTSLVMRAGWPSGFQVGFTI